MIYTRVPAVSMADLDLVFQNIHRETLSKWDCARSTICFLDLNGNTQYIHALTNVIVSSIYTIAWLEVRSTVEKTGNKSARDIVIFLYNTHVSNI